MRCVVLLVVSLVRVLRLATVFVRDEWDSPVSDIYTTYLLKDTIGIYEADGAEVCCEAAG